MVFSNYVTTPAGVPTRMHFTDYYYTNREILDRESGKTKRVWTHVFYVDEYNGDQASATFSIMSQKLWAHLEPFTKDNLFRDYDFIITQLGDGFYKDFNVQVIRRA